MLAALLLPPAGLVPWEAEIGFHHALADRIRHGDEDFYTAALAALRASGLPAGPFTAIPLPLTATILAAVPSLAATLALSLLVTGTGLAWARHVASGIAGRAIVFGLVLLGGGATFAPGMITVPALWAGWLITLSLALRRPGHWLDAAALGAAAALLHEGAAFYIVVMGAWAWRDGSRREALAWCAALVPLGLALSAHVYASSLVAGAVAGAAAASAGPGPALAEVFGAGGYLSPRLAAPVAIVVLLGWSAWRDPIAVRAATVLAAYAIVSIAPTGSSLLPLLCAPMALIGLAPAVDGLRDLLAAALDRRRITVTRVVR
ncbi:hypothetical protein [Sphingomonas metalli]|uniref:hypothetical protein n=1 Tax=Sphingomonas metalli TaxID=1779358 RepID=UPI0016691352|nr:hypothetical protein [Sphingomonas metalli]